METFWIGFFWCFVDGGKCQWVLVSLSLSGILYSQIGRERRRGFENTQVRIWILGRYWVWRGVDIVFYALLGYWFAEMEGQVRKPIPWLLSKFWYHPPLFTRLGLFESLGAPQFVWFTSFSFSFFLLSNCLFLPKFWKGGGVPKMTITPTFFSIYYILSSTNVINSIPLWWKILFSVMFMWIFYLRLNLGPFLSILLNSK